MRFKLTMNVVDHSPILPLNYQYPLSAVIYKILALADNEYSSFLHEKGYTKPGSLKSFKLFTFSDIKTPFKIKGDRMLLSSNNAEIVISFHLPQAAELFIKGLFLSQRIEIADKKSRATFQISSVEALPIGTTKATIEELIVQPISPVVCGLKNESGNYDFIPPNHPQFISMLMHNWQEKWKAAFDHEPYLSEMEMIVLHNANPPKSRLITIKSGTPAETKIRGFLNFRLKVKACKLALELLLNSGIGLYNSLGMGCITQNKL